jgi:hypothetical protein
MNPTREAACPEDVLMALAWYPDGLDAELRGIVEAHAADCAACREELAFVRGEGISPAPREESDRVYARVIERIEAYEAKQRPAARVAAAPAPRRADWGGARAAAALLLAAGVGALVALVASRGLAPEQSVYRAAGETPEVSAAAPAAAPQALDVVFRPDATAERIHAALRAIGGEIVSGPTQLGVYRVHLAPTADANAAAQVLRGEGQGVATFAELAPRPAH